MTPVMGAVGARVDVNMGLPSLDDYPRMASLFGDPLRRQYAAHHQDAPDMLYRILCDSHPEWDALRRELEELLDCADKIGLLDGELTARLRSGDLGQFLAAYSELEAAMFFDERGLRVTPRPEGRPGRAGDLAIDASPPIFVEVKTVLDRQREAATDRASRKLWRYAPPVLKRFTCECLAFFTIVEPARDFRRQSFEQWLHGALSDFACGSATGPWLYRENSGLVIALKLQPYEGSIGHPVMSQMDLGEQVADLYLAATVDAAYEQLPNDGRPALILIRSGLSQLVDADWMMYALYGRPVVRIAPATGDMEGSYSLRGLFYRRPYERLSGVALLSVRRPTRAVKEVTLDVFHYDLARYPLDYTSLRAPGMRHLVRKDERTLEWQD